MKKLIKQHSIIIILANQNLLDECLSDQRFCSLLNLKLVDLNDLKFRKESLEVELRLLFWLDELDSVRGRVNDSDRVLVLDDSESMSYPTVVEGCDHVRSLITFLQLHEAQKPFPVNLPELLAVLSIL